MAKYLFKQTKNTIKPLISNFFFFLFCLSGITAQDIQYAVTKNIVINEIGIGQDSKHQFVELLTIGDVSSPSAPLNLEGWSLDNYSKGNGNDHELIQFGPEFSSVLPGTIILIYDDLYPHPDIDVEKNGFHSAQYYIQVPISSPALVTIDLDNFNVGFTSNSPKSDWKNTLNLMPSNGGLYLKNSAATIVTGVNWAPQNSTGNLPRVYNYDAPLEPWVRGVLISDCYVAHEIPSAIEFVSGSYNSPGINNSPRNKAITTAIRNGILSSISLSSACSELNPETEMASGTGAVNISGGLAPYSIEITDEQGIVSEYTSEQTGLYPISNLSQGTYDVKVTDAEGCFRSCSFTISFLTIEDPVCEGTCTEIGTDLTAEECGFLWEPTEGLKDPNSPKTEACPEKATTYVLKISDGNGNISRTLEYEVGVTDVQPVTIASPLIPLVIDDNWITLTATGEWESYNWSAPYPSSTSTSEASFEINPSDLVNVLQGTAINFTLTTTDENGCTATASISGYQDIDDVPCYPGISVEVAMIGQNCANSNNSIALKATIAGGVPPYYLSWNFGSPDQTQTISNTYLVSAPVWAESWTLSVKDSESCIVSSFGTLESSQSQDADGDGVCEEYDCDDNNPLITGIGSPCDDYNVSTFNDVIINEDCDCAGESDPNDPCEGNDIDGDGVCDADDPAPYNPCNPIDTDFDLDGVCDVVDCDPNDSSIDYAIGYPCDDGNASTLNDVINQNCQCEGVPDPNNECDGNDQDGDGWCDALDPFDDDPCNQLSVELNGDQTICSDQEVEDLIASIENGKPPYTIAWSHSELETALSISIELEWYQVTVTDALGCTAVDEIEIEFYGPDSDGDGVCDDQPCEPMLPDGFAEPAPINIYEIDPSRSREPFDCNLAPIVVGLTEVYEYVPLNYSSTNERINSSNDPLDDLANGINTIINELGGIQNGLIFITSNEFLCNCPEKNLELLNLYDEAINEGNLGVWINFGGDPSNGQDLEVSILPFGYEVSDYPSQEYLFNIEGYEEGNLPNGVNIHPSQLNNLFFSNALTSSGYQGISGSGYKDFANLDGNTQAVITKNVERLNDRYGFDAEFIISADCVTLDFDGNMIPSSEKAKEVYSQSASTEPKLYYWMHQNAGGQVSVEIKITGDLKVYDENSPLYNMDYNFLKEKVVNELYAFAGANQNELKHTSSSPHLSPALEDHLIEDGSELDLGLRKSRLTPLDEDELNFWGYTKAAGGILLGSIKGAKVVDIYWKPKTDCLFDFPGMIAGPLDAAVENNPIATGIQLTGLTYSLFTEPQVRQGLWEAGKHPITTASKLFHQAWDDASGQNGKEQQHYTAGNLAVKTVLGVMYGAQLFAIIQNAGETPFSLAAKAGEKLKAFPDDIADIFYKRLKNVFNSDDLAEQYIKFIGKFDEVKWKHLVANPNLIDVWKKFKDLPSNPPLVNQLHKFEDVLLGKIPVNIPEFWKNFDEVFVDAVGDVATINDKIFDFVNDLDLSDIGLIFTANPSAVKAWKVISSDNAYSGIVANITKVDNHLAKNIHLADELETAFVAATNKAKWIDDIGYNVLRKANSKAEYINPSNNLLKWTDQHPTSINQSIQSALGQPPTAGKFYEGKVADYMQQQGKTIDGFGLQVKNSTNNGNVAGDIDVMDANNIIEVKKSYSAWTGKKEQVNKFVDTSLSNYLNPYGKKAFLYIDETLTAAQKNDILSTIPGNVKLVNTLAELGQHLQ